MQRFLITMDSGKKKKSLNAFIYFPDAADIWNF